MTLLFQLNLISVTIVTILINIIYCQLTDTSYFPTHYRNLNKSEKTSKSLNSNHNDLNVDFCGGNFRDKQTIIQSPRYPSQYPKNVHCVYTFYSPFVCANEFHIQFLDFQLESSVTCSKDRITIGADETLCGQVIGIMKYKSMNGILRINFTTDATIENKGFKLLVTRLPCISDDIDTNLIENPSTISPTIIPSSTPFEQVPFEQVPSMAARNNRPLSVLPKQTETIPITTNLQPICVTQPVNGLWPNRVPATLPSCCINVYNQRRFYIISAGFPNSASYFNDCLYFIERNQPNICRLRIEFKYFLLGDWQRHRCTSSFIEIDGKRFCGCKTGSVFYTQWSATPKTIHFVNLPSNVGIQGFILDIVQEDCPYRSTQVPVPQNFQVSVDDPSRCSPNYLTWLQFNTNHELLARSVCVRNNPFGK